MIIDINIQQYTLLLTSLSFYKEKLKEVKWNNKQAKKNLEVLIHNLEQKILMTKYKEDHKNFIPINEMFELMSLKTKVVEQKIINELSEKEIILILF